MPRPSVTDIAHNLRGVDFPVDKAHLIEYARRKRAKREIMDVLEKMPERKYDTMADVMKGYGQLH